MRQVTRNVLRRMSGITAIEYGLIAALLAVAAVGAIKSFNEGAEDRPASEAATQAK